MESEFLCYRVVVPFLLVLCGGSWQNFHSQNPDVAKSHDWVDQARSCKLEYERRR